VKYLLHFTGCHKKGLNFIPLCIISIFPVMGNGLYVTGTAGLISASSLVLAGTRKEL
jgi:hypothetical protein